MMDRPLSRQTLPSLAAPSSPATLSLGASNGTHAQTRPRTAAPQMTSSNKRAVIVALDGSPHASYALEWALQNVVDPKADRILLINVAKVNEREDPEGGYFCITAAPRQPRASRQASAKQAIDHGTSTLARGEETVKQFACGHEIDCESKVIRGSDPRDELLDFAEDHDGHVLILGKRPSSPQTRYNPRSISTFCAHNARCPVIIVRMPRTAT
ncbi:hypothetical protein THASP1DRAFT_31909 [Thamnocephalis sphaerospora]|uniref:UspA domain-containing protein n=1 Tax=Thamnocephalis sphaerospora TaxID=78915 RepID=A0A4P9XKE5_9FUNG|nr:hypothetical protein THASP1DRAFT_31909 [Thamnocephalis sphaerospora]|eukprot:RKP06273.1 hypothetical protein THASP1DRAFT_31909 [Thamnocephalis sphaerospora]